jgi:hypothetical protein
MEITYRRRIGTSTAISMIIEIKNAPLCAQQVEVSRGIVALT